MRLYVCVLREIGCLMIVLCVVAAVSGKKKNFPMMTSLATYDTNAQSAIPIGNTINYRMQKAKANIFGRIARIKTVGIFFCSKLETINSFCVIKIYIYVLYCFKRLLTDDDYLMMCLAMTTQHTATHAIVRLRGRRDGRHSR